jgi:hypothetical protein
VVFLLDSPVNPDFVAGRVVGLRSADVTHGSLVARVLGGYFRGELVSIAVEDFAGGVDRELYLDGLRRVLEYSRESPSRRVVVNVSLAASDPDPRERELLEALTAEGVLVVAAAGNEDSDALRYPAALPGVVAVASATRRGKALHSNYGRWIDIAASGDISFLDFEFLPYERLRREMEARGTSFAAPRVAGTIAFLLDHRPGLSPVQAWELVRNTARPVDDELFARGMLGAGLLDVRASRARVVPGYSFLHFVLPVCVWVLTGVLSVYLCIRFGFLGMFATVMIWILVLPASYVAVVELGRWLEFVGRGSLIVGLGAASILCAGSALALVVMRWNVLKTAIATAGPLVVLMVVAAVSPAGALTSLYAACGAGLVTVVSAAAWEALVRRRIADVRSLSPSAGAEVTDMLLRILHRTLDVRLRRAAIEKLGELGGPECVEALLTERRLPEAAVHALATLAERNAVAFEPWIHGWHELDREEQSRLQRALTTAGTPEADRLARSISGEVARPE